MRKILTKKFFDRPALEVAPELIGKYLVRRIDGEERGYLITEVEAYTGPEDLASHSSRGKTPRNSVMFGAPGVWYVYLCYGMYWLANVVTGPGEHPSAVLVRGIESVSGPGRLTRALLIDRTIDRKAATRASGLWFEDRGFMVPRGMLKHTPRIGVDYAGAWAKKPYRFVLKEGVMGNGTLQTQADTDEL